MEKRGPVFEKSASVENVYNMRLTALLRELVRDGGFKGAAKALTLDQRTVAVAFRRGVLSRRVRTALERGLQEGEGSAAAEQRERNDELGGRLTDVEAQGKDMSKGFAAIQGDVKAVKNELAQGVAAGGTAADQARRRRDVQDERETANAASGRTQRRAAPWREYPDLVTREPADDDEAVFGAAWPLIAEWRELKDAHPNRGQGP